MIRLLCLVVGLSPVLVKAVCPAAPCAGGGRQITDLGPKCGCRRGTQLWQSPRPELNPPDDVANLPEREQRKFVKIFELVPEQVKVKSTQNYAQRMVFFRSKQYAAITAKLRQRLVRSGKQLAAEPVVTAEEVLRACDETITYGRMLAMGNMGDVQWSALAERYGFKNAAKAVERIDDSKNLRRGLAEGWPERDPECAAFAQLARTANAAQWTAFLARAARLQDVYASQAAGPRRANGKRPMKKQVYDEYDVAASAEVPPDIASLPRRDRVRFDKAFACLPARVRGCAGQDYAARAAFLDSPAYKAVRQELAARLARATPRLAADPAVSAAEVLTMCDETVRFGRPLILGDLRNASWLDLATWYRFPRVAEFIRRAAEERNAKAGFAEVYPASVPEFRDFEILAKKAHPQRWQDFRARVTGYNRVYRQKNSGRVR